MPVPEYVLDKDVNFRGSHGDVITVPAGAFLKPIEYCWVPKHILDEYVGKNIDKHTFCYCRYGIRLIHNDLIRKL